MYDMAEMPVGMKNSSITATIPADVKRYFTRTDNRAELKKILRGAFAVRIVALLIIFLLTPEWSDAFWPQHKYETLLNDDIRFESGAINYSKIASSLVDTNAFRIAYAKYGDWKGYETNWFQATPLWHWICCVAIYLTHTKLAVRLLNITLACFGIQYVYLLAELLFDKKTASLACKLYAFLPYTVLFSCFAYKDQFIFFGTAYLLYVSFRYRYRCRVSIKMTLTALLLAFCCASIRSGLTFVLILMCLFIIFSQYLTRKHSIILMCITLFLCLLFGRDFIMDSLQALFYKASVYQQGRQSMISVNSALSIASISGIRDVYKLPFTFLIAIIMPITTAFKISSWSGVVAAFNTFIMPSVAVGAFLDIFLKKHTDAFVKLICLMYYLACIVTSIGIYRHYYAVLFIPIIMCAHYVSHSSASQKALYMALSAAYTSMLLLLLLYKTIV